MPRRGSWLWPACLCSTGVRDDQDTYTVAPPSTPTADNDAKMADMTSPDVDVADELCTVQMSGGAPFGFRLSDDGKGALVVGKVRMMRHCFTCRLACRVTTTAVLSVTWTHVVYTGTRNYWGQSGHIFQCIVALVRPASFFSGALAP